MYEMENISFEEIESGNRLQQLAVEIITFDRQAKITAVSCAIEIGERLLEAKELVPHGEWGKWLKENVNYSQSTANKEGCDHPRQTHNPQQRIDVIFSRYGNRIGNFIVEERQHTRRDFQDENKQIHNAIP